MSTSTERCLLSPASIDRAAILARWAAQARTHRQRCSVELEKARAQAGPGVERSLRSRMTRRRVVELRRDGLTYEVIARELGISKTTVYAHLRAAREGTANG